MKSIVILLFVLVIGVGVSANANAASLYGKVVEVSEGDTIAIFNLNRSVRVRLRGIDAPELKQRFGDVARQHLSDLVFDKFVTVEYSGISSGNIVGKVMLDKIDICAQMVRDGAAWFDGQQRQVGEFETQVYQQSEMAARQERRGLWQDESPIAPWEFVRAEIERRKPVVTQTTLNPAPAVKKTTSATLDTESLRFAGLPARNLRTPKFDGTGEIVWSTDSPGEIWQTMRPKGESMSAFVPSGGDHTVVQLPWEGQTLDAHYYLSQDEGTIYQAVWVTGPYDGSSDADFMNGFIAKYLESFSRGFEKGSGGVSYSCSSRKATPLTMNGFTGREIDLSSCTLPAVARLYTRTDGGKRRLYFVIGLYRPNGDSGDAYLFVRSLKVGTSPKPAVKK